MKKLLALAVALFATSASAAVSGSLHDMNRYVAAPGIGVCQYCHMPHASNPAVNIAPIWSRTINAPSSYGVKVTGSGQTPNLGTTQNSLLCLSCHDGTVAMGTLWNGQALSSLGTITSLAGGSSFNIGTSLTDDHPVGVTYYSSGTTSATTGLAPVATALAAGYAVFGANIIECGSCHEPHDNTNGRFYRVSGDRCIGCHSGK